MVDKYEIIDVHCHLFNGNGIKTRIKLFTGALVLNYATVERLIMDMDANGIHKSVVQQINPPNKSCAGEMDEIVKGNSKVPTKKTKKEVMTQALSKFENVLACIPDATVILAHGGSFDFPYIIDILKKHPNTYTDISLQPSTNIKQIIGEVGSNRILFGTDYPFLNQAFSMLSVLRATTSISLGLFVFVASEPYFVKKRKDEQVAYGSYFTEEWANSLGEWVTGEKSIGNMVLD